MTEYKCSECDKLFKYKKNYNYHVNNNVCTGKQYAVDDNSINACKYCGKTFTTPTNMYRHMNHTCKIKKAEDQKRDQIYERLVELEKKSEKIDVLEKENKELKKEMKSLKKNVKDDKKVKKITNNTTNNNNTNNINNGIVAHINLIGYGKEDLSKIDKKDILKAIQNGFDSTLRLTETLHFNPKHPEYHNVYITNVKDKYAMMFDGKDWNLTMKDALINKIYDDKKNYIEENLDDFVDSLSTSRKKALERWLETNEEDERIIRVKNEIKLLLYNKRNLAIDNHDNMSLVSKKAKQQSDTIKNKKKILKAPKDTN